MSKYSKIITNFSKRRKNVKILIATDLYESNVSGIVSSVRILKKGLEMQGHDVRILALSDSWREKKKKNVYYIGSFNASFIYPDVRIGLPKVNSCIQRLIDWNPDVIHTNCEFSTFAAACYISRKTKHTPIVLTYHTVYKEYVNYVPLIKPAILMTFPFLHKCIAHKVSAIIAPTVKMKRMLKKFRLPVKIPVIPTPAAGYFLDRDYSSFRDEIRLNLGIGKDECILVYLGRIAREKNIEELLDYIKSRESGRLRLLLVGDGPHRKVLEKYCRENNISDRVIFTGMVSPEDVPKYYGVGDIFVTASVSEAQGLTYLEAMACSLPVLCHYDSCLDGVIENEKNGFIYHTKDEFMHYTNLLKDNSSLRKSVGGEARKLILEKYTPEIFTRSCEKVYRSLVRKK